MKKQQSEFVSVPKVRQMEGTILKNKYLVRRLIGKGSFGQVYKIRDLEGTDKQRLVVKTSLDP